MNAVGKLCTQPWVEPVEDSGRRDAAGSEADIMAALAQADDATVWKVMAALKRRANKAETDKAA